MNKILFFVKKLIAIKFSELDSDGLLVRETGSLTLI